MVIELSGVLRLLRSTLTLLTVLLITLIIVRLSVFSLRLALAVLVFVVMLTVIMAISALLKWFRARRGSGFKEASY